MLNLSALTLNNITWLLAGMAFVIAPHALRLPLWVTSVCVAAGAWRWWIARRALRVPAWWLMGMIALAAAIGAPNSICITPGPNQVLFVGESTFPGRLFKVSLDGKVLGVIGRSGRQLKQFSGVHQLACPSETEVYAAETSNWRVQKLLLRPRP